MSLELFGLGLTISPLPLISVPTPLSPQFSIDLLPPLLLLHRATSLPWCTASGSTCTLKSPTPLPFTFSPPSVHFFSPFRSLFLHSCRIPGGAANGGPLQVVLTQEKLEELTLELWRRCRLPLDQVGGGGDVRCVE